MITQVTKIKPGKILPKLPVRKIKPKHGFAHFFHLSLVAIMPPVVFVFVRLEFITVAVAIVLLSKWRMFAVQPRHWIAHIRTNAVDIIVSLSILSFMINSHDSMAIQLLWLVVFEVWLLYVKPGTSTGFIAIQALLAQFAGMVAVFISFTTAHSSLYVFTAVLIAYFSARHFFGAFEETHVIQYSWLWAFFATSLTWILSHWLLFYGEVAQPALLLGIIGYGLAGLYYLHDRDKLTAIVRRQIMFVVIALVFVIIALSNWGDGIIK